MSVAWLIFRRDLRRLWPLELALGALTVFSASYPRLGADPNDGSLMNGTELLRVVLLALLSVLLIQADLVVTDRADWITRPMRAQAVVGGKVLFVFLTLALPAALIAAASARPYDVSWALCGRFGLESAAQTAVVALFFGLIGALTPSLLGAVNLFAAGAVTLAFLGNYLAALLPSGREVHLNWWYWAIGAAAVAALVAVLALHYRHRRIAPTLAASFGALIALLSLQRCLVAPRLSAPAGIGFRAKSPRGFVGSTLARPFPFPDEAVVGMQAAYTVPPEVDSAIGIWAAHFTASDGRRAGGILPPGASVPSDESFIKNLSSAWNQFPVAAKERFGIDLPGQGRRSFFAVLALPGSRLAGFAGAQGVLALDCLYYPTRLGDPGFLALRAGETLQLPGYRVRLESLRSASGPRIEVGLLATQVHADAAYHHFVWALVNEGSGEVSLAETGSAAPGVSSYYLSESRQHLFFAHRWHRGSGEVAAGVDPGWLKSARLEYFEADSARGENFQAVVPGFTLPAVGGSR